MCSGVFQVMASLPFHSDKDLSYLIFQLQKWPLIHDSGVESLCTLALHEDSICSPLLSSVLTGSLPEL